MKVKHLIALLKQLPQDHEVWYEADQEHALGKEVEHAYLGFIEDERILWHDAEQFEEVETDEKRYVVIIA